MLVRALILWLVMLNLATLAWWWTRDATAAAPVLVPVERGVATPPGLELVRELPPPVEAGLPPCPAPDAADVAVPEATEAPQDCLPLR